MIPAAIRAPTLRARGALQASKQEAVEWEHRFLSQFDYAWNRRSNAAARHVALRQVKHTSCVLADVLGSRSPSM